MAVGAGARAHRGTSRGSQEAGGEPGTRQVSLCEAAVCPRLKPQPSSLGEALFKKCPRPPEPGGRGAGGARPRSPAPPALREGDPRDGEVAGQPARPRGRLSFTCRLLGPHRRPVRGWRAGPPPAARPGAPGPRDPAPGRPPGEPGSPRGPAVRGSSAAGPAPPHLPSSPGPRPRRGARTANPAKPAARAPLAPLTRGACRGPLRSRCG